MTYAVQFDQCGNSDVLEYREITLGSLGPKDVLVKHKAIGVNFIDTYHRSGLYPVELPSGLGKEAAGVVEAIGSEVTHVNIGDRVAYVNAPLGSYATHHIVPQNAIIHLPDYISFEVAAGMMLKGLTAAYLLLKTYKLSAADTVLVHAAAGGVGSIVVPWAKKIGARVIGTVGSEAKVATAKNSGCDDVLLYRDIDVPAVIAELTADQGVDVVYDSVGKDTFQMSLSSLKRRGMLVSFGNASGAVPDFSPLLLAKYGSLFLTRPVLFDYVADPTEQQYLADALFEQVAQKNIAIKVSKQFSLSDAKQAHDLLESGKSTGSTILIPDG